MPATSTFEPTGRVLGWLVSGAGRSTWRSAGANCHPLTTPIISSSNDAVLRSGLTSMTLPSLLTETSSSTSPPPTATERTGIVGRPPTRNLGCPPSGQELSSTVRPHIPLLRANNVRTGFFEREQIESVIRNLPAPVAAVVSFCDITGW